MKSSGSNEAVYEGPSKDARLQAGMRFTVDLLIPDAADSELEEDRKDSQLERISISNSSRRGGRGILSRSGRMKAN